MERSDIPDELNGMGDGACVHGNEEGSSVRDIDEGASVIDEVIVGGAK